MPTSAELAPLWNSDRHIASMASAGGDSSRIEESMRHSFSDGINRLVPADERAQWEKAEAAADLPTAELARRLLTSEQSAFHTLPARLELFTDQVGCCLVRGTVAVRDTVGCT